MDVRLGDFRLEHVLGRGGMGEVWRAEHVRTGLPVAVKVVTAEPARRDRFHEAFRTEVQAMARLNHHGVVMVLDYGRVHEDAHTSSNGHLLVDAPYLAMELCDESLATAVDEVVSWSQARTVLTQILDGLGHAHARSVIHRDIKPQNVLVSRDDDGEMRVKLADFGLAHPVDDPEHVPGASGTPKYMAPEQILGSFHEQGPWTDLYSFGCLARWLVTGATPFESEDSELVFRGHLFDEPSVDDLRFEVPDGYEEWLGLLLAKNPLRRISCAADARNLLEHLGQVGPALAHSRPVAATTERESAQTVVDPTVARLAAPSESQRAPAMEEARRRFEASVRRPRPERVSLAPPHRPDWRRASAPDRRMELVGAGIALYGLRPVPMVGRDAERDAIWADLGRVARTGKPHVVVVRGSAGAGKSRLAQWIGERADEFGAAHVLRAVHSPMGGAADGVGRMIGNYLQLTRLERSRVVHRLEQFMSSDGAGREFDVVDVLALADLATGGAGWGRTAGVRERNGVLMRFLERVGWDRPVLLWIDDAQWGRDALELAVALCESEIGVLLLLTVRQDALVERPLELAAIRELAESTDRFRDITLGPLSRHDHLELVQRMLRLDAGVAKEIATRTEGNPLFAVQLVGDWVERGLLVPGAQGFELRDPSSAALPDSIHNLWSRRIDRAIERFIGRSTAGLGGGPRDVELALWAGAVLGHEVDFLEWQAVCDELEADPSFRLVEELVRLHLAERTLTGFRFAHGMLAESLMRRAADAGALASLHRAAAAMLMRQPERRHALRLAEHHLAAGDGADALDPLLVAAEELTRRGDFATSLALDDRRDQVLEVLEVPQHDVRRVSGWLRRARTRFMMGDYVRADEDVERAATAVRVAPNLTAEADLLWTRVVRARHYDETSDGVRLAERALALFEQLGDAVAVARAHKKLGETHRRLGNLGESIEHYDLAKEALEPLNDCFELGWYHLGVGTSYRHAGQFDEARAHISRALEIFVELGSRLGLGNSHNELGELERAAGNFATAERHYRHAMQLWSRRGHTESELLEYNVALTLIARAKWDEAEEIVRRVYVDVQARGHRALTMLCRGSMACFAAVRDDMEDAEAQFAEFTRLHDAIDLVEPDIAEIAFTLGSLCLDSRPGLARRSLEVARRQYELLQDERVDSVAAMLDELDSTL